MSGWSRRAFISAGVVTSVGIAAGLVALVDSHMRWLASDTRSRRRYRDASGRRQSPSSAAAVRAGMVINLASGIVHWPDARLIRRTPPLKWVRRVDAREWEHALALGHFARADDGRPRRDQPLVGTNRYERTSEPIIRELLALSTIQVSCGPSSLAFAGIDRALGILEPALANSRPVPNARTLVLFARLTCLQYESDPERAHGAFIEAVNRLWQARPPRRSSDATTVDFEVLPFGWAPVLGRASRYPQGWWNDARAFAHWHHKTTEQGLSRHFFRARLARRIESAKALVSQDSSSGQDTFSGERGSNPRSCVTPHVPRRRSLWARTKKRVRHRLHSLERRFRNARDRRRQARKKMSGLRLQSR